MIEREPAAIWQHNGAIDVLIDAAGVTLARVSARQCAQSAAADRTRCQCKQAQASSTRCSAKATRLKPLIAAATWIGDRRWDIQFQTSEDAIAARRRRCRRKRRSAKFDGLDASERLLGRGLVRFDMRDPSRMFVRVKRHAGADDYAAQGECGART